jgi:hypothetical protein
MLASFSGGRSIFWLVAQPVIDRAAARAKLRKCFILEISFRYGCFGASDDGVRKSLAGGRSVETGSGNAEFV